MTLQRWGMTLHRWGTSLHRGTLSYFCIEHADRGSAKGEKERPAAVALGLPHRSKT